VFAIHRTAEYVGVIKPRWVRSRSDGGSGRSRAAPSSRCQSPTLLRPNGRDPNRIASTTDHLGLITPRIQRVLCMANTELEVLRIIPPPRAW